VQNESQSGYRFGIEIREQGTEDRDQGSRNLIRSVSFSYKKAEFSAKNRAKSTVFSVQIVNR